MKIIDHFSPFIESFEATGSVKTALQAAPTLKTLYARAQDWGVDFHEVEKWMHSPAYGNQRELGHQFLKNAHEIVEKIESVFGETLEGEVLLGPSLIWFDGFARYDSGYHTVLFGVDHPDACENYLKALLAHELSHVYRDHRPAVWAFLKKPLKEISRQEYLDNVSAHEHLASEGLATLFSQLVFPEVGIHLHHYYSPQEMMWCDENEAKIEASLLSCLKGDENVWSFYGEDRVAPGSPSRTQYYWAARKIKSWLDSLGGNYRKLLIEAHGWPADEFEIFNK